MNEAWVVLLGALFALSLALLVVAIIKLRKQRRLIELQGAEIQKQLRELTAQNQVQEALNREKQQLIGVVSHDLKGPFNRIFALIQLMAMDQKNLTEEQLDYLGKIHQITADGMNMVRNLVDARKMDDDGIDLRTEKLNFALLLTNLVKQYRVLAEKKKIEIVLASPDTLEVWADRVYLSRMIDNLISNALKFSPYQKTIRVELAEENGFARVAVSDEGPGFSPEDEQRLYQKFQKLSARPTGGESSTGLGLSIVKRLVEKMGGNISYRAQPGSGTTFAIRIPKGQPA
jgi:signal transduction histidine kinase